MPSKLKKLVRERMAKTGESYQTALRHVRSKRGNMHTTIEQIIALAAKRNAADAASRRMRQRPPVSFVGDGTSFEEMEEWREIQRPLLAALYALPEDQLRKVQAVMYAGRDDDPYQWLLDHLGRDEHKVRAQMIAGKMPLDEYLKQGLEAVARDGIDLDAPIPPRD